MIWLALALALLTACFVGVLARLLTAGDRLGVLQSRLRAQSERVAELEEELSVQRRRADEFFGVIQDIERERDNWNRLWRENAVTAGNAQSWLMRDLQRMTAVANNYAERLQKLGDTSAKKVAVNPALAELLEEFRNAANNKGEAQDPLPTELSRS